MNSRHSREHRLDRLKFFSAGIIIIFIGVLFGDCSGSYLIPSGCLLLGIFFIIKGFLRGGIYSANNKNESEPPELVFKNNESAFEYICMYVVFDYDMAPGLVINSRKINNYNELKIKCFYNGKTTVIEDSLNLLGDKVGEGDLVVCISAMGKMLVSYLLAPKFNQNTKAWPVILNSGEIKVKEIPVRHLQQQRLLSQSLSKLEFKSAQEAFTYVRQYMLYHPNRCVGLIKDKVGTTHDDINYFMVNVADDRNPKIKEIALQHPDLSTNLQIGDLVGMIVDHDSEMLKKLGLKSDTDRCCIITSKLEPVFFFRSSAKKTIQELAMYYLKMFEIKSDMRSDIDFWRVKGSYEESPPELRELIDKVEFNIMPDNFKCKFLVESLAAIAKCTFDVDAIIPIADTHPDKLTQWLTSHRLRHKYVDEVSQNGFQAEKNNTYDLLSHAQWMEKKEVLVSVIESLREIQSQVRYKLEEVPIFENN